MDVDRCFSGWWRFTVENQQPIANHPEELQRWIDGWHCLKWGLCKHYGKDLLRRAQQIEHALWNLTMGINSETGAENGIRFEIRNIWWLLLLKKIKIRIENSANCKHCTHVRLIMFCCSLEILIVYFLYCNKACQPLYKC